MPQISLLKIVRAPFFSSILAPLLYGSFIAAALNRSFDPVNFALIILLGVCIHAATNVYNDIYDTLQGTDRINQHRNDFSGGSGLLVAHPELLPRFFRIARTSVLLTALIAIPLMLRIDPALRLPFMATVLLAIFFSKFYTAAPIKLGYRGWGEISVWFAFGPMAVAVAVLAQNLFWHPVIWAAMPATGLSTASILLVGQLIDREADDQGGKHGVAVRRGSTATARLYLGVQILLLADILAVALLLRPTGFLLLLALLPYTRLPRTARSVLQYADDPEKLKSAAGDNVRIHLLFSVLLSLSSAVIAMLAG